MGSGGGVRSARAATANASSCAGCASVAGVMGFAGSGVAVCPAAGQLGEHGQLAHVLGVGVLLA